MSSIINNSNKEQSGFLVYILKKACADSYAWVIKEHIEHDVDKTKIKFDGDLGTKQFLAKYGDFSNDRFFICYGSSKYLETRIMSECDFYAMKRYQVIKDEINDEYIFVEIQ